MKRIFKISAWLLAFNISFWIMLFQKYIDYRYEYTLFRTMAVINSVKGDEAQTFKNLVALTYRIQSARAANVQGMQGMNPIKSRLFRSGDMQLLDANGSCGNFSHVLAEFCAAIEIPVRLVQLKQNNNFGSHIIIEAKINGKWAVADCLFKTILYKSDSSLASMEDVQKNPEIFSNQFPVNYPYKDAYLDYRYTNWYKVPVVMHLLKRVITLVKGPSWTNTFSMRVYFLNLHKAQFFFLLFLYLPIFLYTSWYLYCYFFKNNFV